MTETKLDSNGSRRNVGKDAPSSRRFSIKPTLQILLISAVLLSISAAGFVLMIETRSVLNTLARNHFQAVSFGVSALVDNDLEMIPKMLRELHFLASEAEFDFNNIDDIQDQLLSQAIGFDPGTAVGYVDLKRGAYAVAVHHEGGRITLDEERDYPNEVEIDVYVDARGLKQTSKSQSDTLSDYQNAAWYKTALAAPGIHWTGVYELTTGHRGISAAIRYQPTGSAEAIGIFHVDLPISHMSRWLSGLKAGETGFVFLLDSNGGVFVAPEADNADEKARLPFAIEALKLSENVDFEAARKNTSVLFVDKGVRVSNGNVYHVAQSPFTVEGGLDLIAAIIVPEGDFLSLAIDRLVRAALICVVVIVLVAWAGTTFANRISAPILAIANDVRDIARMRISDAPAPESFVREVAILGDAVDRMKSGMRSLERYIPPEVARRLIERGETAALGVERRELSIYVSDIRGFTGIAENAEPTELVEELRIYFDAMTAMVRENGGIIDKFMGDGILAYFNAPVDLEQHSVQSCRAALASQAWLETHNAANIGRSIPPFHVRIGLGFGDVLIGNVGSTVQFGYTAIGDAVNVAARLEGVNKFYGTRIIATSDIRERATDLFEWRALDKISVAGHSRGIMIYELLGAVGEVDAELLHARDVYQAALQSYIQGDFHKAFLGFTEAAALRLNDDAAMAMARRARKLRRDPPADDWGGVYALSKL